MTPYEQLTTRGQIGRLRTLGKHALREYPLTEPSLRFIHHGENTTFRVNESAPADGRSPHSPAPGDRQRQMPTYLLRVHRPGYQNDRSVRSELIWLDALAKTGVAAPVPVRTRSGEPLVTVSMPGVPRERICSLLRWIDGRFVENPSTRHYSALGELMARLHLHTAAWRPPAGFHRRAWDWEGLFGENAGFAAPAAEVWRALPNRARPAVELAADRIRTVMQALGTGRDAYGLIHADLHFSNVLFAKGRAVPIDFDDC